MLGPITQTEDELYELYKQVQKEVSFLSNQAKEEVLIREFIRKILEKEMQDA